MFDDVKKETYLKFWGDEMRWVGDGTEIPAAR